MTGGVADFLTNLFRVDLWKHGSPQPPFAAQPVPRTSHVVLSRRPQAQHRAQSNLTGGLLSRSGPGPLAGLSSRASLTTDRSHQQSRVAIRAPRLRPMGRGFQLLSPAGGRGSTPTSPHSEAWAERRAEPSVIPKGGCGNPMSQAAAGHPGEAGLATPPSSAHPQIQAASPQPWQPHPTLGGPGCLDSRPAT